MTCRHPPDLHQALRADSLPPSHSYYQEDGTYQGGVQDFKEGWDAVAKACREIAPEVKMWYTPNVAPLSQCTTDCFLSPARSLTREADFSDTLQTTSTSLTTRRLST